MNKFINDDFMLTCEAARRLYHEHAANMPIIDYHCHLNPQLIAENYRFRNITEVWLGGDHYKWRAMRANGVSEEYITGSKSDEEKFEKWAETLPYTMRNPLYHWTHMELSQLFGIDEILKPATARSIYEQCNTMLAGEEFRTQALMRRCNVQVVCTTDDPVDTLEYHKQIAENSFGVKVLPTWRPDRALAIQHTETFNAYMDQLETAANTSIGTYTELLAALQNRHNYFERMGCKLSDHGMSTFVAEDYTEREVHRMFEAVRRGKELDQEQVAKFQSSLLHDLAVMDAHSSWTQQFHIGVIRNNCSRMFAKVGADTGFDAIDDARCAAAGHKFLSRLDAAGALAKTILYNLNPKDNAVLASMASTFNDGSVPGKMQFGAAWWFLDQEQGMRDQISTLSAQGLLSRFVGMLTDSRSFLSYPRHDYFRRILCDVIGRDVEQGKLPASEMEFIGSMVEGIAYNNAKQYFDF